MKKIIILAAVLLIGFLQPGFAQDMTDMTDTTYQHSGQGKKYYLRLER